MKRTEPDNRIAHCADERLDGLVTEALRELTTPARPVDVKARVMAAWDERVTAGAPETSIPSAVNWWSAPRVLKPASVFAGALVIFVGLFLAWSHVQRQFDWADQYASSSPARRVRPNTQPPEDAASAKPLAQTQAVSEEGSTSGAAAPRRRPRSRLVTVQWQVEQQAEAGPYLPGAPAGELGDGTRPLPEAPPITFAPIDSAPPISEIARPVTDFPADTQPPATARPDAGQSGGQRR